VVSANPEPAAAPADAGAGALTTADVRRVWPELRAAVKRQKRTTDALLQNAQVSELSGDVLTLTTTSPALARRLGDDLNKDILRSALEELLGVRWKVQVVTDGAGGGGGPARGNPEASREAAREAERAADAAEARELMAERAAETTSDRPPEPVVDPEQAALSLLRAQLGARPIDE
jgi:DNA polymerase-3 subunit gamma/tau